MEELEKNIRVNRLIDLYGSLLTKHQYEILSLYYYMDLSLSEISEQLEISRNGVYDALTFKPQQHFHFDVETSFKLLQSNLGLSPSVITSSLKVPVLNDFAVMLDVYTKLISSKKIKEKTLEELRDFLMAE